MSDLGDLFEAAEREEARLLGGRPEPDVLVDAATITAPFRDRTPITEADEAEGLAAFLKEIEGALRSKDAWEFERLFDRAEFTRIALGHVAGTAGAMLAIVRGAELPELNRIAFPFRPTDWDLASVRRDPQDPSRVVVGAWYHVEHWDTHRIAWWLHRRDDGWRICDFRVVDWGFRWSEFVGLFCFGPRCRAARRYFDLVGRAVTAYTAHRAGDDDFMHRLAEIEAETEDEPLPTTLQALLDAWIARFRRHSNHLASAAACRRSLEANRTPAGWMLLARLAETDERYADVLPLLDEYERRAGPGPDLDDLRCQCLLQLGRTEEARDACRRALDVRVTPDRLSNLVGTLPDGEAEEIAAWIGKAPPAEQPRLGVCAVAFCNSGNRPVSADRLLARVVLEQPDSYDALWLAADRAARRDDLDEAIAFRRKSIDVAPDERHREDAITKYLEASAGLGRIVAALEDLGPHRAEGFRIALAGTWEHRGAGMLVEELAAATAMREREAPDDPWVIFARARLQLADGDAEASWRTVAPVIGRILAVEPPQSSLPTKVLGHLKALAGALGAAASPENEDRAIAADDCRKATDLVYRHLQAVHGWEVADAIETAASDATVQGDLPAACALWERVREALGVEQFDSSWRIRSYATALCDVEGWQSAFRRWPGNDEVHRLCIGRLKSEFRERELHDVCRDESVAVPLRAESLSYLGDHEGLVDLLLPWDATSAARYGEWDRPELRRMLVHSLTHLGRHDEAEAVARCIPHDELHASEAALLQLHVARRDATAAQALLDRSPDFVAEYMGLRRTIDEMIGLEPFGLVLRTPAFRPVLERAPLEPVRIHPRLRMLLLLARPIASDAESLRRRLGGACAVAELDPIASNDRGNLSVPADRIVAVVVEGVAFLVSHGTGRCLAPHEMRVPRGPLRHPFDAHRAWLRILCLDWSRPMRDIRATLPRLVVGLAGDDGLALGIGGELEVPFIPWDTSARTWLEESRTRWSPLPRPVHVAFSRAYDDPVDDAWIRTERRKRRVVEAWDRRIVPAAEGRSSGSVVLSTRLRADAQLPLELRAERAIEPFVGFVGEIVRGVPFHADLQPGARGMLTQPYTEAWRIEREKRPP